MFSCQVTWLNPTESQHSIQWDTEMCAAGGSETKALFEKACKDALYPPEQQLLSRAFESDHRLVHSVGLTPAKVGIHTFASLLVISLEQFLFTHTCTWPTLMKCMCTHIHTHTQMPQLIEKNPTVAIDALLTLTQSPAQIGE